MVWQVEEAQKGGAPAAAGGAAGVAPVSDQALREATGAAKAAAPLVAAKPLEKPEADLYTVRPARAGSMIKKEQVLKERIIIVFS